MVCKENKNLSKTRLNWEKKLRNHPPISVSKPIKRYSYICFEKKINRVMIVYRLRKLQNLKIKVGPLFQLKM